MVWVRLADDFTDHPKVVTAGPLASWLYVCGLTYANRYLTDGFIPAGQVRRMADVDDSAALAAKLVDVGLWEPVEGGYRIHDYHGYQPSSEDVKRERENTAKRQAEFKARKRDSGDGNAVSNGVTNAIETPAPYPDPARSRNPVPEPGQDPSRTPDALAVDGAGGAGGDDHGADAPPKPKRAKPRGTKPRTDPPETLEPNTADYAKGERLGMSPDVVDSKAEDMLDYHRKESKTSGDWHASLRTWLANAPKYDQPRASPNHRNGSSRPPPTGPASKIPTDASAYFDGPDGYQLPRR